MKNKLIVFFVISFIVIPTCVLATCADTSGNQILECDYNEAKNIIKEIMRDYYIRGSFLQYNSSRVSYGEMSPEDATSQNPNYKVCSAFADDVYKFSFGIEAVNGNYAKFPRYADSVLDTARCLYSKVPNSNVTLSSSDQTKCNALNTGYSNFLIYYATNSNNGSGNEYVDGYTSNLNKIEIKSFVEKLQPGDVIVYTGHVMVIYDIGINPITGEKDALVLNVTQQPWIKTRIAGTSKISYNKYKSKYYNYNEYGTETKITTNGIIDVEEEGAVQHFWLGASSNWRYFEDEKRYLSCPKNDECAIIRPYYKSGTNAIFNYEISKSMYEKSKLRLEYPGIFMDKTVDVGTGDVVHIGDTLTYKISVTNKSKATFNGTGSSYGKFYIKDKLDSNVEYISCTEPSGTSCVILTETNGDNIVKSVLFTVNSLQSGKTVSLTYKVKVKDDLNNVGKTIESTGKFYEESDGAYISLATIKNKIVPKVKSVESITTEKYNTEYNKAVNSGKTGLALVDEVIKNTIGKSFNFANNFHFEDIIGRRIDNNTVREYSNAVYLKNYTKDSNNVCTTTNIYENMILNGYFGGLTYKTLEANQTTVSTYFFPLWMNSSSNNLDPCKTVLSRAMTIKGEDFKNGDVLIYYIDNEITSSSLRNTTEQGLYAYIYINGEFKGVNGTGTTSRNTFTYNYYIDNTNLSILDNLYPFYYTSNATSQIILDYYSDIRNSSVKTAGTTETVLDNEAISFANYQTLYDKDYYVILRPELVMKEPAKIIVKTNPKTEYLKNIEDLDLTGGKLTVKYNNGTEEEINLTDSKVDVSGFNNSVVGSNTLLITYEGLTTELTLNIVESDHTVTYNANGGSGTMSNQQMNYNTSTPLTANAFTRANYTFAGWNTKADGSGTSYTDKQSIKITSNITLYAKWTPIEEVSVTDYDYNKTNLLIDLIDQKTSLTNYQKKVKAQGTYTLEVNLNGKNYIYTGSKTLVKNGTTTVLELTNIVRGDVDGNGEVKSMDYIKVKNHIMNKNKLTGVYLKAADANKDNNLSSLDYIRIKKIVMNAN